MTNVKKVATRESYGKTLAELGNEIENLVVLDADLAGATKTGIFKKAFPDRFIDCGIAECDMMGIAAGMATCGAIPFASTFAMFAAGRAFEIVRNSIGYPHLNVKIGATHAGISVGEDGASHQCNEDLALMRTIPGMTIINPSDDVEARAAVRAAATTEGPFYLRFGRFAVPVINDRPDYKFDAGSGRHLRRSHQHPHHQASGQGSDRCFRKEDRKSRHGGRALHHRRSWRRCLRSPVRDSSHACPQDRRKGRIRRVRPRS